MKYLNKTLVATAFIVGSALHAQSTSPEFYQNPNTVTSYQAEGIPLFTEDVDNVQQYPPNEYQYPQSSSTYYYYTPGYNTGYYNGYNTGYYNNAYPLYWGGGNWGNRGWNDHDWDHHGGRGHHDRGHHGQGHHGGQSFHGGQSRHGGGHQGGHGGGHHGGHHGR